MTTTVCKQLHLPTDKDWTEDAKAAGLWANSFSLVKKIFF